MPVKKICEVCGKDYYVKPSHADKRHTCSKDCQFKYQSLHHIGGNSSNWKGGKIKKICEICGKEYTVFPVKFNDRHTCGSKECNSKYKSKISGNLNWDIKRSNNGKIKQICEICGKEYFIMPCEINVRHTCSKECKYKYQSLYFSGKNNPLYKDKIKKVCEICKKEYFIYPYENNKRHTCSKECQFKYQAMRQRGKNNPRYKDKIKKVCEICGKEYFVILSQANKCTCSRDCYSKYRSLYFINDNSSNWKGGNIKKICEICGKEYFVSRSRFNNRHTCGNKECTLQYLIEVRRGPLWYGNVTYTDNKQYCEKWNNSLRTRIREYYDNKSILSGKTKEDNGNRQLTCHHVYYQKKACCIWDEDAQGYYAIIDGEKYYIKGDPNKFVTLTADEHGKVSKNKLHWIKLFEDLIDNDYDGKCYYTKEEYNSLNN